MKSLFLACLLMVTSMYTLAQVAEGNKFVNGTVNLALLGGNNNLVVLAPEFGYFINDKTAIGGSLGVIYSWTDNSNNVSVTLSPFIRKYFSIVEDKFFFFLDGRVTLAYGSFTVGDLDITGNDIFSISLNAAPGFIYFPSERWSLDFTLSGFSLNFVNLIENPSVSLNLGVSTVSPGLGFSYYF